uniref:Uncharacterized protein n=1 Tax=viral metagenome TaxID=1070528 RepID=A0A6H1ZV12_9ZZZZ
MRNQENIEIDGEMAILSERTAEQVLDAVEIIKDKKIDEQLSIMMAAIAISQSLGYWIEGQNIIKRIILRRRYTASGILKRCAIKELEEIMIKLAELEGGDAIGCEKCGNKYIRKKKAKVQKSEE